MFHIYFILPWRSNTFDHKTLQRAFIALYKYQLSAYLGEIMCEQQKRMAVVKRLLLETKVNWSKSAVEIFQKKMFYTLSSPKIQLERSVTSILIKITLLQLTIYFTPVFYYQSYPITFHLISFHYMPIWWRFITCQPVKIIYQVPIIYIYI